MSQPSFRIIDESGRRPGRREVLLGILATTLGVPRVAIPAEVTDLGTHLSINGWVISKRELSGG